MNTIKVKKENEQQYDNQKTMTYIYTNNVLKQFTMFSKQYAKKHDIEHERLRVMLVFVSEKGMKLHGLSFDK